MNVTEEVYYSLCEKCQDKIFRYIKEKAIEVEEDGKEEISN